MALGTYEWKNYVVKLEHEFIRQLLFVLHATWTEIFIEAVITKFKNMSLGNKLKIMFSYKKFNIL